MQRYNSMKKYVISRDKETGSEKHVFYPILESEVLEAEKMMERNFPYELRDFYIQIGYGFLCRESSTFINRFMHPNDVADLYLGNSPYDNIDKDMYENYELPFYHIGGEDFLTLDLREESKGHCRVLYFGEEVSSSVLEFVLKMDEDANYYLNM